MSAKRARKLAVIISKRKSLWISCNSIGPNLIRSYDLLARNTGMQIDWVAVCSEAEKQDTEVGTGYFVNLARQIEQSGAEDLIFLDHQIDPLPILVALYARLGPRFKRMRFTFHIYGDFTLFPDRWFAVGEYLKGAKAKFVSASERQRGLVSFFEPDGESNSCVCPFPVNTQMFRYSGKSRTEVRGKLGLRREDVLVLYTGRLSLQKNITRMVDEFSRLSKMRREKLYFALAGPYDNIGGLTCGITAPSGFYFHQVQETLARLPADLRKRILFLDDLDHEELKKIYSAADVFLSLSMHHDEDFGMCPAEAISSGLPGVLSDWGGYASFRAENIPMSFVPVYLGRRGLELDSETVLQQLSHWLDNPQTPEQRLRTGREFAKQFGIEAIARALEPLLAPETFAQSSGFDWALESYADQGVLKGGLYNDVYRHYATPNH